MERMNVSNLQLVSNIYLTIQIGAAMLLFLLTSELTLVYFNDGCRSSVFTIEAFYYVDNSLKLVYFKDGFGALVFTA